MHRVCVSILLCLAGAMVCCQRAGGQATSAERVASFQRPVFATSPPGDTDRLFVAEQFVGNDTGRIRIVDLDTDTIIGTFLEIPNLADGGETSGSEQGLLGLAFDPDFETNGYFYVNITTTAGGGDTAIRRYKVSDSDPNVADPNSGVDVLTYNQPQGNHNGGWIGFSPNDGYLYITSGDGGGSHDNDAGHTTGTGNAQDTTNNLLGKILRIDPSRDETPAVTYTVPADNPFVGVTGDDEIWSYGLRNPYRASFDRQTGDLWIGDVGQSSREEIDFQPASSPGGENYGWRLREGTIATPNPPGQIVGGERPEGNVDPIYDYTRGSGALQGNVVIGGYVYRGPIETFQGHYIFADGGSNNIWSLDPEAIDPAASVINFNNRLMPDVSSIVGISSFGEDAEGNLYFTDLFAGGDLFRIVSTAEDIVWNGDDAGAGVVGDGTSWGSGANWTRAGVPDVPFVTEDHVIFAAGSSQPNIDLEGNRTVSAATFNAPFTLEQDTLTVRSGNVTVADGVTATIDSDLQAETEHHSIRKLGPGKLLVNGDAHQTVVKQGNLGGSGSFDHLTVEGGATLAPGTSAGILHVDESLTLEAGSTLEIELGGTDNSNPNDPEFDQLLVGGLASLGGGLLEVSLIDGFQPGANDSFPILVAQSGFDSFADENLPDLESGLEWLVNPGGTTLSLNVQIALVGDYNQDGTVDAADYTAWQDSLGAEVVPGSHADGNGDGLINMADYTEWATNFGNSTGVATSAAVPEPCSLLLCLLCLLPGVAGRWKTRGDRG